MFTRFCVLLLFFAASSFAETRVLEVSVVTDWETVLHYTSIDEIESRIGSTFGHANNIFVDQLNIDIKITHIDIPTTEAEDKLINGTLVGNLANSLIDYRNENVEHANADVTVLLTKRNIIATHSNTLGYAMTGKICTTSSVVIVELLDNGLDYLTLAHELAHVLGALHDGNEPCENETKTGWLMSSLIHKATPFLSQCSIETINLKIDTSGGCLFEDNTTIIETTPPNPFVEAGGGGSTDIIFLLLLFIMVVTTTQSTRTDLNARRAHNTAGAERRDHG